MDGSGWPAARDPEHPCPPRRKLSSPAGRHRSCGYAVWPLEAAARDGRRSRGLPVSFRFWHNRRPMGGFSLVPNLRGKPPRSSAAPMSFAMTYAQLARATGKHQRRRRPYRPSQRSPRQVAATARCRGTGTLLQIPGNDRPGSVRWYGVAASSRPQESASSPHGFRRLVAGGRQGCRAAP